MADSDDEFPEILTADQVRFEITFGLRKAKCYLREWKGEKERSAALAERLIVDELVARFNRLQVRRAAPTSNPFWHVGNNK